MRKLAFYPRRLSDKIVLINTQSIKKQPVDTYPTIDNRFFFAYYPNDSNKILSTETNHWFMVLTLQDSVTGKYYAITGNAFVGGHPIHRPHYNG